MKRSWKADLSRFIELISLRLYSDPIKAGIRELITNSLDARIGKVEIWIDYDEKEKKLRYTDTGAGIDPESFEEVYGKIASGHKRKKESRGFFGIGRMSLIAASEKGMIISYKDGKVYKWSFDKEGWEGPKVEEDKDEIGHGIYLQFDGLVIEDLKKIEKWIRKTFSIPLLKKECTLKFQYRDLDSMINEEFTEHGLKKTKYGNLKLYTKEEMNGTLYICQKGILVKEEDYTGLTAFVDQDFLDIKTDREGFVNNEKYRYFKRVLKKELAKLRPRESFEKMEVDFIRRLMKEFKKYWFKKVKENNVLEKLKIEFPKEGDEIIKEEDSNSPDIPEERETESMSELEPFEPSKSIIEETEETIEYPTIKPLEREIPRFQEKITPIEDVQNISSTEPSNEKVETPKEKETKTVKIKGARPVQLGKEFPMIFFETEPFTLVFNTTHPVFRKFLERGKLGSSELAVLFERMFEAIYISEEQPNLSLEEVKKRWVKVDQKLKEIFK